MSYNNNGYNNYGQNNYSQGSYGQPTYGQSYDQSYYGGNNPMYNQGGYSTDGYNSYDRQGAMNQYNTQYNTASNYADEISFQSFNLIIGAVLLYGFIVNAVMVGLFTDSIVEFVIMQPILFYIGYFAMAIIGGIMIHKSDNPIVSFIGYNLFVVPIGMVIAVTIECYVVTGYASVVSTAFLITGGVTVAMMFLVIELIAFFAGASLGIIDYVVVVIFCGYIGYDWAKANALRKTVDSAIDAASELYLDIANLFLRIMRILARSQNN